VIAGIAIFIITLCVDLYTDLRLFYQKKHVNHFRGAALRCIGLAPAIYFLGWWSIPMLFFWYLVFFNGIYNLFINQSWEFVGATAAMDKLQRKHPWLKFVKYAGLIGSTFLYIVL
jgi:hypothetical protein